MAADQVFWVLGSGIEPNSRAVLIAARAYVLVTRRSPSFGMGNQVPPQ